MTHDDFVNALHNWQNFYLLTGGAAATLTGLMFVAVTFGAGLVSRASMLESARAFIDPTFAQFLQILLTGCVLVIPTLTAGILGVLVVLAALVRLIGLAWVLRHMLRANALHHDIEVSDWVLSIALPGLAYLVLGAAGVGFLMGRTEAFTGLAVVTVALLAIGVWSAWELLVWMVTVSATRGGDKDPPA